ncbi:MAG: hypothetical protein CMI56_00205 [Parcubacteria group bacterium]|nr:hypothetical protein [Parcubacteria group bacterium]
MLQSEKESPAKLVKRIIRASTRAENVQENAAVDDVLVGDDNENSNLDASEECAFLSCYGEWQTYAWNPPPVQNGEIPTNSHGNWEVWTSAHVPHGAVHIDIPRIHQTAALLNIPFVRAVVGFKLQPGGKYAPEFGGILVTLTSQEIIRDAHEAMEQDRAAMMMKRSVLKIHARWRRLIRSLRVRSKVRRLFRGKESSSLSVTSTSGGNKQHCHKFTEVVHEEAGRITKRCACGYEKKFELI